MKKVVSVTEVEGEGLEALLGEKITLFCMNYFYTGKLIGVNKTCVLLEDPAIIYDTGSFTNKSYSDSQSLNVKQFYVQISAIESFGILK
jgi:hypothetical protein